MDDIRCKVRNDGLAVMIDAFSHTKQMRTRLLDSVAAVDWVTEERRTTRGRRYKYDTLIKEDETKQPPVAVISYGPNNPSNSFARLDVNLGRIGVRGTEKIAQVLRLWLEEGFEHAMINAHITKLHTAVDVRGVSVKDIGVWVETSVNTTTWHHADWNSSTERVLAIGRETDRKGNLIRLHLRTVRVGSGKSDASVQVYDKRSERKVRGMPAPKHRLVRIESQFTPRRVVEKPEGGKIVRLGCEPGELSELKNPFAGLGVAVLPAVATEDPTMRLMLEVALTNGAARAVALAGDSRTRAKFRALLMESAADWWQPEVVWKQALHELKHCGLFPQGAFSRQR